ncbi:hypothetical protein MTO96_001423 [Rhipicephalus appendiculatus]
MDRSKGLHRRLSGHLDEPTTVTKCWSPFRPTCHYNRGAVPPLGDYGMFLEGHGWFYNGERKIHEDVVASTQDAATNRHRSCLEDHGSASCPNLQWGPSAGLESAVRETILDRNLAVGRRRRVATTRRVCDGSAVKSLLAEVDALLLSETATKIPALLEVIPVEANRTGGSLKKRSAPTSTLDIGTDELPKTKAPRLEVRESGTAGPSHVCEGRAEPQPHAAMDSKSKDTGLGEPMDNDTEPV